MAATDDNHPDEYVTERRLDKYHIPPRTAQRWRTTGGGPPWIRLGRRKVIYRVRDVEEWLAARTYRHRADELARGRQSADDAEWVPTSWGSHLDRYRPPGRNGDQSDLGRAARH